MFQSTPPYGGRRLIEHYEYVVDGFQSTPPYGGRHNPLQSGKPLFGFNPRPRMGGDVILSIMRFNKFEFQSTPPYGGRPHTRELLLSLRAVSIHAPVWGAT